MLLTNTPLSVYEVVIAEYNSEYEYVECIDTEYIVTQQVESYEDIIAATFPDSEKLKGVLVQVFEAKSAELNLTMSGGVISEVEVNEADCSTGYSGSPIMEVYYDSQGERV